MTSRVTKRCIPRTIAAAIAYLVPLSCLAAAGALVANAVSALASPVPPAPIAASAPPTGYRLPWAAGQTAMVTQVDNADTDHMSQVDFLLADPNGAVYAAKPGTVVYVKQSSAANCQVLPSLSACWQKANAIVIQHGPAELSWYVHLAYGSATVTAGQHVDYGTKIAVEGDTGYTCNADCSGPGRHLHFMVSARHDIGAHCDGFGCWPDPNDPDDLPWGLDIMAVDFAEVSWADLKPGQSYTSQNAPSPLARLGLVSRLDPADLGVRW